MNKFKISYHPGINLNIDKATSVYVTSGWKVGSIEWDEYKLLEVVKTNGLMPSILKTGETERIKDNIHGAQSIMLDFDSAENTFEQMLAEVKTYPYAAFIFTSINHQKPKKGPDGNSIICDRFRILIPFDREINTEQYQRLGEYYLNKYSTVDPSFGMISRYFYVTNATVSHFHNPMNEEGNSIFLNPFDLISEIPPKKSIGRPALKDTFSTSDYIILENKKSMQIKDVKVEVDKPAKIYCPFCTDRQGTNANAHLNVNSRGEYNIWCFSKSKLYYQNPEEINYDKYLVFNLINSNRVMGVEKGLFLNYENPNAWKSYCNTYGLNPGCKPYLKRLQATYDPKLKSGIIPSKELFNLYDESPLLTKAKNNKIPESEATLEWLEQKTPYSYKILMNLFGEKDYLELFLNWISVGLERKNYTLWMIVTVPGAGKNLIMEQLLSNIIKQSATIESVKLTDRFNSLITNKQLLAIDECFLRDYQTNNKTLQHIKNLTGSRELAAEPKNIDAVMIPNFLNLILFTNHLISVHIEGADRRFNVIRNPNSIEISTESWWPGMPEIDNILNKEAEDFAVYLVSRNKDVNKASVVLETEAKKMIQGASEDTYDTITTWFKNEDWSAFRWDEIFVGNIFNEPKPYEVLEDCINFGGVPSKYWGKVVEHYFRFKTTESVNKILKPKGITVKKRKRNGIQSQVYYYIDNVSKFKTDEEVKEEIFE